MCHHRSVFLEGQISQIEGMKSFDFVCVHTAAWFQGEMWHAQAPRGSKIQHTIYLDILCTYCLQYFLSPRWFCRVFQVDCVVTPCFVKSLQSQCEDPGRVYSGLHAARTKQWCCSTTMTHDLIKRSPQEIDVNPFNIIILSLMLSDSVERSCLCGKAYLPEPLKSADF